MAAQALGMWQPSRQPRGTPRFGILVLGVAAAGWAWTSRLPAWSTAADATGSTWPGVPGSCRRGKRLGNIALTPITWHYPPWLDICSAVPACYGRVAIDRLLRTLAAQDRPLSDELRQRRNYCWR